MQDVEHRKMRRVDIDEDIADRLRDVEPVVSDRGGADVHTSCRLAMEVESADDLRPDPCNGPVGQLVVYAHWSAPTNRPG